MRRRHQAMNIRTATVRDMAGIMQIISQAQACLKSMGIDQWQNGYPARQDILLDIRTGSAHVLQDGEETVAYACISFAEEKHYRQIRGQWQSSLPCAVVHRLAVHQERRGQGLASGILQFAETLCSSKGIHSIKVDTHADNTVMRHILTANGYCHCGTVSFDDGAKMAFEKLL